MWLLEASNTLRKHLLPPAGLVPSPLTLCALFTSTFATLYGIFYLFIESPDKKSQNTLAYSNWIIVVNTMYYTNHLSKVKHQGSKKYLRDSILLKPNKSSYHIPLFHSSIHTCKIF